MEKIVLNTLIVGTGAAGYNAAIRLKKSGIDNLLLVTEGVNMGTSRNTGSDKQTYYKLGLAGDSEDSVHKMASDIFACGATDGDTALCEAALSARCFLNLCELGVPFPTNRYGEFVGYKTDHDPCARATSVGPLTSKEMTEKLQAEAARVGVPVKDGCLIVKLIRSEEHVTGAVGFDRKTGEFCVFEAGNIVFATGGPGGIYADSVYPVGHNGSQGVLFEAGVTGQNLTYWQYGLASVAPRWNVSGTYMQVLPRFVSVDESGAEREFLYEYFANEGELLSAVFMKGYQWPFDSKKVLTGSSVIDLLVYREKVMRGRRVFLDFRQNPGQKEKLNYASLSKEAREYLENAGACFGTPIERLAHMNQPAIDLYASKGVDLTSEMLEVAVCAQHNNGGIKVNDWWESDLKHLFVCGEAAGTHGISRPGGSALNAGQVGSTRAAQYITARYRAIMPDPSFEAAAAEAVAQAEKLRSQLLGSGKSVKVIGDEARKRMSACGGLLREKKQLDRALSETEALLVDFGNVCHCENLSELFEAFRLRDTLLSQETYLRAMRAYCDSPYGTSGSALYADENGQKREGLDECFRFTPDDGTVGGFIQETPADREPFFRPVRPLPEGGGFFENVWRGYRENGNIE